MNGTMAITMAGMGSRFTKAGYTRPKYEIMAHGRALFDWSMLSLAAFRDAGWHFSFAVREGLGAPEYLRARCKALGIAVGEILSLDGVTDGQATTARLLADRAPAEAPFAIYNIDTFVTPYAMQPPDPAALAGWIPCFPGPGEGWSFARLDTAGRVVEVREKQRISPHATVGLYWFENSRRFLAAYDAYYSVAGREERGERYVAPLYNQMIAEGLSVGIDVLAFDAVGMLGTPEQLDAFSAAPAPQIGDGASAAPGPASQA
ncbi:MAG: glycosyltransferase family 2 protein [Pseudomonadota bacterium]